MSEEVRVSTIKKGKPQKEKKKKDSSSNSNWSAILLCGLIAIILAIAAFFVLLSQEKKALDEGEKIQVYIAKEDIAAGTPITKAMFKQDYVITNLVPASAQNITEDDLTGSLYTITNLNKNGILTEDMLSPVAEDGTQEIGIATASLASAINGILRDSDYVDIYVIPEDWTPSSTTYTAVAYDETSIDEETGETITTQKYKDVPGGLSLQDYSIAPTFQHVFVSKVFDGDGNRIATSDAESHVSNFNVVLDAQDANYLVGALQSGTVYVTKYKSSEPGKYISNVQYTIDTVAEDVNSSVIDEFPADENSEILDNAENETEIETDVDTVDETAVSNENSEMTTETEE